MRVKVAVVLGLLAGCGGGGVTAPGPAAPAPSPSPTVEPRPVLSVPAVDLDRVALFLPFGARMSNGVLNPAYYLVTDGRGHDVRAVSPGVVTRIGVNPDRDDYEVHVRPFPSSAYLIVYDHVLDLAVAEGTAVGPGHRLGAVGHHGPGQGFTELQINHRVTSDVSLCPRDLGTAAFNDAHEAAFLATRSPHASVCLMPTVVP